MSAGEAPIRISLVAHMILLHEVCYDVIRTHSDDNQNRVGSSCVLLIHFIHEYMGHRLAGFQPGIEGATRSGLFNFLRAISQVLTFQVPWIRSVVYFSLPGQPGCLCTEGRLKNHSEVGDGQQDLRVY